MKTIKNILLVAVLFLGLQQIASAQNWGFSLPGGMGGFAINGKNWTAGYAGAWAGGGRGGWGFGLPNGAGFYNGGGNCGYGGGYGGGWGGGYCAPTPPPPASCGPAYNPKPPYVRYGRDGAAYVFRNPPTAYSSGWVRYQ